MSGSQLSYGQDFRFCVTLRDRLLRLRDGPDPIPTFPCKGKGSRSALSLDIRDVLGTTTAGRSGIAEPRGREAKVLMGFGNGRAHAPGDG